MYNILQIGKAAGGSYEFKGALSFKTSAPLDDRFVVKNKVGLICANVFGKIESGGVNTNKKEWIYQGLSVTVQDTGDTYVLTNIDNLTLYFLGDPQNPDAGTINYHIEHDKDAGQAWIDSEIKKGWTRMAKASEVSDLQTTVNQNMQTLSGVFQFKGIATSITDDMDAISKSTLTVTNSGSESAVSESGYELKSIQYDIAHQLFYGWEKTSPTTGFAAEYYTTDKDSKVYTKSAEQTSTVYVDIEGERYYTKTISGGYITSFESLIGNVLYPQAGINASAQSYSTAVNFYNNSTTKDETTLVGTAVPQINRAHTFSEVSNFAVSNLAEIKVIPASGIVDGNTTTPVNGWVYQIGEKEYASNGLIWVELGSPKEEITWLVL